MIDDDDLASTATEWMLLNDAIEDEIDAIPLWHHAKAIQRIFIDVNNDPSAPTYALPTYCGCRYYRRTEQAILQCTCGHGFDYHEEQRRCWAYSGAVRWVSGGG